MNPIVSNGNKMKWKFETMETMTDDEMYSDKCTFKGVDWKILAYTSFEMEGALVCLFHESKQREEETWICEIKSVIKILNQNYNGQDWTKSVVYFSDDDTRMSNGRFFEWEILETEGYMKDNSIIVEIEFDFNYYDFSKNIPNSIILNLDQTKFYVNKEILCSESEYFYNKFVVENSDEKELTIDEDVRIISFRRFIAFVCLFFDTVNKKNYKEFIGIAAKYKIPRFHKLCEKILNSKMLLTLDEMFEYADKNDYSELMTTCIDLLTKTSQIEKIQESTNLMSWKDTTKRAIEKKMLENKRKEKEMMETIEAEKQLKCQDCSIMDLEKNFHICQTCNEQNLKHFENEEEILKIAICSACAIRKHMRENHVTIDFFPIMLDYKLKHEMKTVQVTLDSFESITCVRKAEEQIWKTLNEAAKTKFDKLIDITRQSKSTKNLHQNMDEINSFIETTKNQTEKYVELMRAQTQSIQENLQKMDKWINEKTNECVNDEESTQSFGATGKAND